MAMLNNQMVYENRGQNAHNIAGVMKRKEKMILNGFRGI